ncbi:hypothetical protein [Winogradskyella forsetii]|uniref:hypothetical protein n=1 Tax=Winogradskyella forsetii TaxID=2686077 RepID=UPI0015BA23D5|nr:hypothetical protein [Winogradskyella forsetii]
MKKILLSLVVVLCAAQVQSQTLGEFKTKVDNFGTKPKKKSSKKIYINSFNVMVEVYREDIDYKGKREFRGKGRAEATSQAALGLLGVDGELLQQKTDQLYSEFIEDLKAKGFQIMTSDQVKDVDYYRKSVAFKGPMVRESANPGMLEIIPTSFSGFTSEKNAEGKKSQKSGLFPGLNGASKLVRNTNMLSKQLDDAIVIDVNLALTWSETGGSWFAGLGGANAQVKTNLALGEKAVSAPNENGKSKGKEDYYILPNDFVVAQGSGLKKVTWKGYLKKPIGISGVIQDTKVQSYNKGNVATSYDIGNMYKVTSWTSSISENAKFVEVDGEQFSEALYMSGKAFIKDQLNYLFDQYKL